MTRSRIAVAALLVAVPLLAGACDEGPNLPAAPQAYTASAAPGHVGALVTLLYSSFEPAVVTIQVGETVEWQWRDNPIPHDVYIPDFAFSNGTTGAVESPTMLTGTWYQQFNVPGTYHYQCTVHENMIGVVIVEPPGGATGATGGGTS
jgi:plastocyanin